MQGDFPLENLSMDVGPARQPHSPLVFRVGAEPHFPCLEQFPTLSEWLSSINQETSTDKDVEKEELFCTVVGNAD